MSRSANLNFVQQQGFRDAGAPACEFQYPALIFGKFCLGSYVFHLLRGEAAFANRTLPWVRSD